MTLIKWAIYLLVYAPIAYMAVRVTVLILMAVVGLIQRRK